jgi:hypothetical protein
MQYSSAVVNHLKLEIHNETNWILRRTYGMLSFWQIFSSELDRAGVIQL